MRSRSKTVSLALGAWASGVFVVLWVGAVIGVAGGGALFDQAWAWLGGLGIAASIVTWILFLPVCVGLWATQAGLAAPATIAIVVLLVAWTALAWGTLARRLADRRR